MSLTRVSYSMLGAGYQVSPDDFGATGGADDTVAVAPLAKKTRTGGKNKKSKSKPKSKSKKSKQNKTKKYR